MSEHFEHQADQPLKVINVPSGTVVTMGDQQVALPMLSTLEREMDKINGFFQAFRLGRIARKKDVATQGAIAAGEIDIIRATVSSQARTIIAVVDRAAKAHEAETLALLKNWVESRLRAAREQAHIALQRSFLRVVVQYAAHRELVKKQELPDDLQKLALGKAQEVFVRAWEEVAAVNFKI